jgi:glycosyltransferase involved in cell wall biosynthesis
VCNAADILDRKKKVVLFAGRLELESKRVDRLLSIWKSIENKEGWLLKIAGDGPHREKLEQTASEENITDVLFMGSCDNIEPCYEEASIIVLTSTYEGLPLCFIERIQFGAVPVSFSVSQGIKDILEDISPDILIEPFDADKYAECLTKLMCNDSYRNSAAQKALEKSHEYKMESIGQQWDKLIE